MSDWHDRTIPEPNSGCLLWEGATVAGGYGVFSRAGKLVLAHRVAWEEANGTIPVGLHVCHTCDVPGCCNPAHLFLGTAVDNARDMVAKGRARGGGFFSAAKTHCKRGHPFDEANTRIDHGKRQCRICDRLRWRRADERAKQ